MLRRKGKGKTLHKISLMCDCKQFNDVEIKGEKKSKLDSIKYVKFRRRKRWEQKRKK